jgi:hypothetical protein
MFIYLLSSLSTKQIYEGEKERCKRFKRPKEWSVKHLKHQLKARRK